MQKHQKNKLGHIEHITASELESGLGLVYHTVIACGTTDTHRVVMKLTFYVHAGELNSLFQQPTRYTLKEISILVVIAYD